MKTMVTCLLLFVLTGPTAALAQEDNTGTNPVNFTYDARFIAEMAELDGGGSLLTGVFELRAPLGRNIANLRGQGQGSLFYDMGSRFGVRFRGRYQNLSVPNPASDPFGTSQVSGIGDIRILAHHNNDPSRQRAPPKPTLNLH